MSRHWRCTCTYEPWDGLCEFCERRIDLAEQDRDYPHMESEADHAADLADDDLRSRGDLY